MKLEKAIELFRKRIEVEEYSGMTTNTLKEAMKTVLNELEKAEKVIDEMAQILTSYMSTIANEPYDLSLGPNTRKMTLEEVKEYFYKKVSE